MAAADLTSIRKPVVGFEGLYEVDDQGRLFLLRTGRQSRKKPTGIGYVQVVLKTADGRRVDEYLHRIVCRAFHGDPPSEDKSHTNHLNGDKADNRPCNLEWCTRSENLLHSYRVLGHKAAATGLFGADNCGSQEIEGINAAGVVVRRFAAIQEAARSGYSAGCISMCINGQRPHHKGLRWRRSEESNPQSPAASAA